MHRYFTLKYWSKKPVLSFLIPMFTDFINDRCFEKAATLTYYSLLAMIPILAIAFAVATGLGWEEKLAEQIRDSLELQPEIAEKIITFSKATLKQTRTGWIAGLGLLLLVWTGFRLVANIGAYFNEIWHLKKKRTFWQEVKVYLPLIFLFPLFMIAANSLVLTLSRLAFRPYAQFLSPALDTVLDYFPLLLLWVLFTFLYLYLPHRKVPWSIALISGAVTALLYQIWQWVYIHFQLKSSSYGAIYGSFAAIPLFLIWLYYSWLIILFGTEISAHLAKYRRKHL